MPGRLNPREYDLGELRDAAREPHRRRAVEDVPIESLVDNGQASVEDGRSVAVEPEDEVASPVDGETPAEAASDHHRGAEQDSPADEVESYLQSCHQRQQSQSVELRQAEPREQPEQAEQDHAPSTAVFLAELSGPHVSKPYLDRLPDAYGAQLEVFDWLDELLSAAGHEATMSALEYYESIGWVSEQCRTELEDVAAGLSTAETTGRSLNIDDHRESLTHVARLAHRRQA
jgi:archaellum component FlaD/FlaE